MTKEAARRKFKTEDGHVYVKVGELTDSDKTAIQTVTQSIKPDHPEEKLTLTTARVVMDEATGERIILVNGFKTKPKDRSKRILKNPTAVAEENIVHGTRRRKHVNYKECTEKRKESISHNTYEERQRKTSKKKATSKKTSKKRTTSRDEDEEDEMEMMHDDKENVDQQQQQPLEEETEAQPIPKKEKRPTKKSKKAQQAAQQQIQSEQPTQDAAAWPHPLSPKVCELIEKLGGELPLSIKKRRYRDMVLSDAISLFGSIQWKRGSSLYVADKSKVNDEEICMEHQLFLMDPDQYEHIEWFRGKDDFIFLGDSDSALCVCRLSESSDDFPIYLVMEACEDLPEVVLKFSLSEYLGMLCVKEEQEDSMQL
ncbi:hypothetical protein C9374_010643 [Naegleria lovaniensis]|uniref:Uncharacterized protein n=1 Tax=Naegleria lovaniensis TaxID=51637 RepID=A0AA88GHE2_NAELO|nr:uncharacterized protein C9374_010643 [Naegleria lovaniensis]KAG2374624.1 hypothetical protein C9374_010643 [Naegleria lovaniensis]